MMNILVLGAGRMGLGAVHDLVQQPDVTTVTVADAVAGKAQHIATVVGSPKVKPVQIDVSDHTAVVALMKQHAAAISCVNYWLNEKLARAALEAGCHFCDLGGNNTAVDAALALEEEARAPGPNILPGRGPAPRMGARAARPGGAASAAPGRTPNPRAGYPPNA